MAAQQGFQYEKNASDSLKAKKFVPANFVPAGAGHDQPDLIIVKNNKQSGCELKITDASAGSLVLKFIPGKGWGFDPSSREDKEKAFIMDLADDVNLFDQINEKWTDTPYKVEKQYQDSKWQSTVGKMDLKARYQRDLAFFKDLKGSISATMIEQYYNRKDTHYVNIGTHGFYLFGSSNPLSFSRVPSFSNSADAGWRARVQYKGSGNYQFTFEMNFKVRIKSPYNIAPITKNNVSIIESQVKLPS